MTSAISITTVRGATMDAELSSNYEVCLLEFHNLLESYLRYFR